MKLGVFLIAPGTSEESKNRNFVGVVIFLKFSEILYFYSF